MIRKARKQESLQIAGLMLLAMEDLVHTFLGTHDSQQALEFMYGLVQQKGNQYSFGNTWVAVEDNQVVGSITVYDGAMLQQLRQPVLSLLSEEYDRNIAPENETGRGEYYIDTIAVHPDYQGRGFGTQLLRHVIGQIGHQREKTLGLLVDTMNPKAKRLYAQLGFEKVGDKRLMGRLYEHLQLDPLH